MPGIFALEFQACLTEDGCKIPIIFIAAQGDETVRMQASRAGTVEFLIKPFDDKAMLASIVSDLDGHTFPVIAEIL
jgi:FixJ family two-component response regulator